jgi:hypothetical protein
MPLTRHTAAVETGSGKLRGREMSPSNEPTGTQRADSLTATHRCSCRSACRAGAGIDLAQGHPLAGNLQRVTASETATEIQGAARRELERALKATGGFASRVHHRPR